MEHCEKCVTFESGIHWCPNNKCSCCQTQEEQVADIAEHQNNCSHPIEEQFRGRCLRCAALIKQEKRSGETFYKRKKKEVKKKKEEE